MEDGRPKEAIEMLSEARFRIIDSLIEEKAFSFLAIGRPEGAGCYCKVNAYLKEVISLLAGDFDYVVIDGEAGIEQINRRVMEKVTHLLCVSDQSRKGIQIIATINEVANTLVAADQVGAVLNRVLLPERVTESEIGGVPLLAVIPPDPAHAENDIEGRSVFDLPPDSVLLSGARTILQRMNIL